MISLAQLALLEDAIAEAESWRGMHVGAAPDWFVDAFDNRIKNTKKALVAARETRNELLALKRKLRKSS